MSSLVIAAAGNVAYHLGASRLLGPEQYGALATLLSLLLVVSLPTAALQVTTTRQLACLPDSASLAVGRAVGATLLATGLVVVVGVAAIPAATSFLHLESGLAVLASVLFVPVAFVAAILRGALLGKGQHVFVAWALVCSVTARLSIGLWAAELAGVAGAIAATVVIEAVHTVALAHRARETLGRQAGAEPVRLGESVLAGAALGGLWALPAVELLLARHVLPAGSAGAYAVVATAARVVLFLPQALATVVHVRFSAASERDSWHLLRAAAITSLATLVVAGTGLVIGADWLLPVAFGPGYSPSIWLVLLVTVGAGLLGLANLFVHFRLARGQQAAHVGWVGTAVAVAGALVFARSSMQIAAIACVGAAVALATSWPRRSLSTAPDRRPTTVADVDVLVPAGRA